MKKYLILTFLQINHVFLKIIMSVFNSNKLSNVLLMTYFVNERSFIAFIMFDLST